MDMAGIPFGITAWREIEPSERAGQRGRALSRSRVFGTIRVRMVEYSPGYESDHWCEKGHILLCLEGRLDTELADGRSVTLLPGMSYQVADATLAHRSRTDCGALLFIVD